MNMDEGLTMDPREERLKVEDIVKPVNRGTIDEATRILTKYKQGKANLEQRVIENQRWYRLRHWECMRKAQAKLDKSEVEPASGWLFNAIANKHASAMDNFPSANILPREKGDQEEAKKLASIIPVVLDMAEFEQTYSEGWDDKLIGGTGVYGIFWDPEKHDGIGDVAIECCDILSLFWEPGIMDIQKSPHLFHTELMENEELEAMYPQLEGRLGGTWLNVSEYIYDDAVDTTTKSLVVDWYYKKNGLLHYCKFVNDQVIYASENETEPVVDEFGTVVRGSMAQTGYYAHGLYPFVFDPLFRTKGTPAGFGYIDVAKSSQEYIDRGNQAIMKNMLANAAPRYFVRKDGGVNKEQYADLTNEFVDVEGSMDEKAIRPIDGKPLNDIYVSCINNKIDELKETTGNRDISTGGTTGGVTAASGLAAMMEAGSKLDRDANKAAYRAYRKIVLMVIELIRQFYDIPRQFRILGENGAQEFVDYSNAGIQQQNVPMMDGSMGIRTPLFDIEITAQKASPYSRLSQNELALQFFGAGFFNPQMADQALACLDMMDFDRKDFVMQRIAQNGTMFQQMIMMQQQMIQMAQIIDSMRGTNMAQQMAAGINGGPIPPAMMGAEDPAATAEQTEQTEALGGRGGPKEHHSTKNARQRVAESTAPV
jgi:hypothetical protein